VTSSTGFRAHPSAIISQNQSLLAQLATVPAEASKRIQAWTDAIRERELAEKRRRAPGWLDRDEKILEPERVASPVPEGTRKGHQEVQDLLSGGDEGTDGGDNATEATDRTGADLGAQMDKAFGALG